jgi:UDP-glucuronate 4-epimerase
MILITGHAGFIGYSLTKELILSGYKVIGLDDFNDYYNPALKELRNNNLICLARELNTDFTFFRGKVENISDVYNYLFNQEITLIIHLAAQAGVRNSILDPRAYMRSNVDGFFELLEFARTANISKILYASTSSVYGNSSNIPTSEICETSLPLQFYAATKKTNEIFAQAYSNIYDLSLIGLRFFTVYGPWGRPDMAFFKFAKAIDNSDVLSLFNKGNHFRSFTYIDDLTKMIKKIIVHESSEEKKSAEIYNVGNPDSHSLLDFLHLIEDSLGKKAKIKYLPLQIGDVFQTQADMSKFISHYGPLPHMTTLTEGIQKTIAWYKENKHYFRP